MSKDECVSLSTGDYLTYYFMITSLGPLIDDEYYRFCERRTYLLSGGWAL